MIRIRGESAVLNGSGPPRTIPERGVFFLGAGAANDGVGASDT
jgi:hypothetical protein